MHFHLNREKRNQEKEKYIKNEDKKNNPHGSYSHGCRLFAGTEQECGHQPLFLERYLYTAV